MGSYIALLMLMVVLTASCKKRSNCDQPCDAVYVGTVHPDSAYLMFFPYQDKDTLQFVSNTGDIIRYVSEAIKSEVGRGADIKAIRDKPCRDCDDAVLLTNFTQPIGAIEQNIEGYLLIMKDVDFYHRYENIEEVENLTEKLLIVLADKAWSLSLADSTTHGSYAESEFKKTFHWGNHEYKDVFHIYHDQIISSDNTLKGVYYSIEHGLLGYYFGNGQEWYLQ